jgi:hypothetical protein
MMKRMAMILVTVAAVVGMAMAARYERGLFDPDAAPGTSPFDHYIYVIASDGDMEEGVTSEACSLAGTQQLGNLIVFWDDNEISIEHNTNIAFTENTPARYEAYGWHVQVVEGGENVAGIEKAIEAAKKVTDKPSFIALRTIIGYPAPTKMNTGGVHGSALGAEEVAATKKILGFDPDRSFVAILGAHAIKACDPSSASGKDDGRKAVEQGCAVRINAAIQCLGQIGHARNQTCNTRRGRDGSSIDHTGRGFDHCQHRLAASTFHHVGGFCSGVHLGHHDAGKALRLGCGQIIAMPRRANAIHPQEQCPIAPSAIQCSRHGSGAGIGLGIGLNSIFQIEDDGISGQGARLGDGAGPVGGQIQ